MSTYVYGITASSHPALPEGMGGVGDPPRPVRVIEEGELAAIVSEAPEGLRPKRKDLLAHQNVLSEAGAGGPLLPMRFGSVAPDDASVTGVLAERAEHYLERLRALDGKVEYNVKASHDEEAVLHRVMGENPELRAMTEANRQAGGGTYEDRLRLGEMVVAAVQAREAEDAAELRRALEPTAAAASAGPDSTGWLANLSFLVDRESAAVFLDAVEEVRKSHPHIEVRVNGPLPPYSFVEPGRRSPLRRRTDSAFRAGPRRVAHTALQGRGGEYMGLITEVLLLPFAPVRGSLWAVGQVVTEAERQYYDPAAVRADLARLEQRLDAGEIDEEEFDRLEDELLDRLEISSQRSTGTGNGTT